MFDLFYSVVGLGKKRTHYLKNNQLVIEMSSGGYCSTHDYQSFIYFACSDKHVSSPIKLKNN